MTTKERSTAPVVFAAQLDVDPSGKQDWSIDMRPLEPFLKLVHADCTPPAVDRSSAPVGKVELRIQRYGKSAMYMLATVNARRASALQGAEPLYIISVQVNTRPEYTHRTSATKEATAERAARMIKRLISFYLVQLGWRSVTKPYVYTTGPKRGTPSGDQQEFWCAPCAPVQCSDKLVCERHLLCAEGAHMIKGVIKV
jgi:hypothetical protein